MRGGSNCVLLSVCSLACSYSKREEIVVIIKSGFSVVDLNLDGVGIWMFEGIVLSAGITIFSLGLLLVSLASYKKYKNMKLLFISLMFIVFLTKRIVLSFRLFFSKRSVLDVFFSGSCPLVFCDAEEIKP